MRVNSVGSGSNALLVAWAERIKQVQGRRSCTNKDEVGKTPLPSPSNEGIEVFLGQIRHTQHVEYSFLELEGEKRTQQGVERYKYMQMIFDSQENQDFVRVEGYA